MPSRQRTQEPLIFAWNTKDHSTWHLVAALLLLIGTMAGFFFVFRIVHPAAQRAPVTPQHVLALDPKDPVALVLIHRAQDRSFALLSDASPAEDLRGILPDFRPSFEGHHLDLKTPASKAATLRRPHLFTPGSGVLPPVPPRLIEAPVRQPTAELQVVVSGTLAKRGLSTITLRNIPLTQPERVHFRVAVGAQGQVISSLPLSGIEDVKVMKQLQSVLASLRFPRSASDSIEWGEISFRWETPKP